MFNSLWDKKHLELLTSGHLCVLKVFPVNFFLEIVEIKWLFKRLSKTFGNRSIVILFYAGYDVSIGFKLF